MLWTESNQLFSQPSISLAWAPAQVTVTDGSLSVSPAVLGLSCCSWAFSSCSVLLSGCRVRASCCGGFCCGAGTRGTGLVALQPVGSSQTRDQTCVPCIGRRILNHWTNREVLCQIQGKIRSQGAGQGIVRFKVQASEAVV